MGPKLIVGAVAPDRHFTRWRPDSVLQPGGNAPGDSFGPVDFGSRRCQRRRIRGRHHRRTARRDELHRQWRRRESIPAKDGSMLYAFVGRARRSTTSRTPVGGGGDSVNQDGFADLVVGWPADSSPGRWFQGLCLRVLGRRRHGALHVGRRRSRRHVRRLSVANAQDVNADGFDDVIVGAPGSDLNGVRLRCSLRLLGQGMAAISTRSAASRRLARLLRASVLST
jgi:hypothetical protein